MRISSVFAKIKSLLVDKPTPEQTYRRSLALCVFLLGVILFSLHKTGLLAIHDTRVKPGEIDLSGTWKIKFDDKEEYARPDLDDSDWCLISVPNAGIKAAPLSERDKPAADCPKENYPKEKMRNATYWYRKEVVIPPGAKWEKPSLFLGAVKDEAWVYWDGTYVGAADIETAPASIRINKNLFKSALVLSIRVKSAEVLNPGIFHAYKRKVVFGEHREGLKESLILRQENYELFTVIVLQVSALLLLLFLIARSKGQREDFFWVAIYFAASCVYSCSVLVNEKSKILLEYSSLIMMSAAIFSYGTIFFSKDESSRFFFRRIGFLVAIFSIALGFIKYSNVAFALLPIYKVDRILAFYALAHFLFSAGKYLSRPLLQIGHFDSRKIETGEWKIIVALFLLHAVVFFTSLMSGSTAYFFHAPLLTSVLTLAIVALSIEDYVSKERTLAFFGRFIRPGLKQLLSENRSRSESEQKWFRGKEIPIIKVDIVGYTQSTYGMPYGLKRVFQDLWFKHVDEVLAGKSFFDKPEGDGSIYFVQDGLPGGSCVATIEAVTQIRDYVVPEFDKAFIGTVQSILANVDELKTPMERFMRIYREKTGEDFWSRKTKVRFAIVYGFVDEGLWGLKSQSHYDVQGDLLILASRLEKCSVDEDIIVTEPFIKKWQSELPEGVDKFDVQWSESTLKGVGKYRFATLRNKKGLQAHGDAA